MNRRERRASKLSKTGVPLGIYPLDPVPGKPPAAVEQTEDDCFVLYGGRRIAKRGKPNTPHAKQWVSLEPGFVVRDVRDNADRTAITIELYGVRVH